MSSSSSWAAFTLCLVWGLDRWRVLLTDFALIYLAISACQQPGAGISSPHPYLSLDPSLPLLIPWCWAPPRGGLGVLCGLGLASVSGRPCMPGLRDGAFAAPSSLPHGGQTPLWHRTSLGSVRISSPRWCSAPPPEVEVFVSSVCLALMNFVFLQMISYPSLAGRQIIPLLLPQRHGSWPESHGPVSFLLFPQQLKAFAS